MRYLIPVILCALPGILFWFWLLSPGPDPRPTDEEHRRQMHQDHLRTIRQITSLTEEKMRQAAIDHEWRQR